MSATETATSIRSRLMRDCDGSEIVARTTREERALRRWVHKGYLHRIAGQRYIPTDTGHHITGQRYILTDTGHFLRDIMRNGA
jgi:hypothetical protein